MSNPLTTAQKATLDGLHPLYGLLGLGALLNTVVAQVAGAPTMAKAVEASNHIDVTLQACDAQGKPAAEVKPVIVWVSDTAKAAVSGTPPSGAATAQTGVVIYQAADNGRALCVTDANGVLVLRVNEASAKSFWINFIVDFQVVSIEITFA